MLVEGVGYGLVGIDAHLDGVRVSGLCQIGDGKGVVLGSEAEVSRGLRPVDEEFVVLGTLYLDLALEVVVVVHVEREQSHAPALVE